MFSNISLYRKIGSVKSVFFLKISQVFDRILQPSGLAKLQVNSEGQIHFLPFVNPLQFSKAVFADIFCIGEFENCLISSIFSMLPRPSTIGHFDFFDSSF